MHISPSLRTKLGVALGLTAGVFAFSYSFQGKLFSRSNGLRSPSSESGLMGWVRDVTDRSACRVLTEENCVPCLDKMTDEVLQGDARKFPLKEVEGQSEDVVRELFRFRMALLDDVRPILSKGAPNSACALSLRRALRHLRGVEDYVGVIGYRARNRHLSPEAEPVNKGYYRAVADNTRVAKPPVQFPEVSFPEASPLEGPPYLPPSVLLNPSLTSPPGVRSGDILLSRGNAAASALIARMAHEDTQFSHLALVYVDPKDGKAWTIEAHIEYGSIVTPLKQWLSDGKSRTMVFRYKDADVAHRAAEWMFNRVAPPYRAGESIEYDFSFNMHDHSKLFCSEVIREGYEHATGGKEEVPLFPSRIAMKNRDLMDRLGISQSASFIPADMELDPRFSVVGEWRNFRKLSDVWTKDAILTSIYSWLERDGYRFDSNFWLETKGLIAKGIRNVGMIKDRMPTYMSHSAVVLSFMVDTMTEEFQARLVSIEAEHQARTGYPMNYYQILAELDRMKKAEGPSAKGPFRYLHP